MYSLNKFLYIYVILFSFWTFRDVSGINGAFWNACKWQMFLHFLREEFRNQSQRYEDRLNELNTVHHLIIIKLYFNHCVRKKIPIRNENLSSVFYEPAGPIELNKINEHNGLKAGIFVLISMDINWIWTWWHSTSPVGFSAAHTHRFINWFGVQTNPYAGSKYIRLTVRCWSHRIGSDQSGLLFLWPVCSSMLCTMMSYIIFFVAFQLCLN